VGPIAGLEYVEIQQLLTLPGVELRILDHPARSQLLHRLRYRVTALRHAFISLHSAQNISEPELRHREGKSGGGGGGWKG
jgi:hypothetical protein